METFRFRSRFSERIKCKISFIKAISGECTLKKFSGNCQPVHSTLKLKIENEAKQRIINNKV